MSKILIKNAEIVTDGPDYPKKYIGITDRKITYIGKDKPEGYDDAQVIDATGKLAAAGMVNAHTHIAMCLLRSYGDDMALMDWLQNKVWPAEAGLKDGDCYWGTQLGILEMLKGGTTSFADMYFFEDETAKAVEESGIRACLARGLTGDKYDKEDQRLAENVRLYKDWNGKADGRLTVMLGPHAPYTCTEEYLKLLVEAAGELGSEMHMHLSETQQEVKDCVAQHGKTPIAYADSLGILDRGCLIAHAVWATDEEIDLMAKKHARVAHNPQSNLKLASGIAPVEKMMAKGITVGLGTDGATSNNNLDMLEETRLAAMLHKGVTYDPLCIPAAQAWDMATYQGARCIGYKDLGKLEEGYLADIVLYDMDKPYWYPRHDRMSLLVYAASANDADTVIVNGRVIMEKGEVKTLDAEKIYAEAGQIAARLTHH
ncbi:MAG: amidohydrolase [Succiniclasticum sp.]|jgi:5-methylthioadenosine/S-adenosylhomocysteine deaminase|nr:amidohydrolase [Succiniclasticum sp.]MEE3478504.1 amidohydrolase [Succiniclasticum sp.]